MNDTERAALEAARSGDWKLADSLECDYHRSFTEIKVAELLGLKPERVCFARLYRAVPHIGIVVAFQVTDGDVCDFCNGEGTIEAELEYKGRYLGDHEMECPDCDGSGGDAASKYAVWTDVDGAIVARSHDEFQALFDLRRMAA